jgi:hypothetical protein
MLFTLRTEKLNSFPAENDTLPMEKKREKRATFLMVYATRPWILKQNRVGREILVYIGYFFPALPWR